MAWIGPGLSVGAGYPSWSDAVRELCDVCAVSRFDAGFSGSDELIDKAEECKLANQDAYHGYLAKKFGRTLGVTEQLLLLMRLPFKAFVTTNFDPQLNELATTLGRFELQAYPGLDARCLGPASHTDKVPIF